MQCSHCLLSQRTRLVAQRGVAAWLCTPRGFGITAQLWDVQEVLCSHRPLWDRSAVCSVGLSASERLINPG